MTLTNWLFQSRGWVAILILVPAGLGTLLSPLHCPPGSWGHFGFNCLGWILFLAGAAARWWGTLYVGGRKVVDLVEEGPYSLSRNPIYFGTLLLVLSIGAFSQSAVFSLAVVVVAVAYLVLALSVEERDLRERHGDRFEAYCRRVPRFFPRFRGFQTPETIPVHASGLWSEFVRAWRWALIPIVCEFVTYLRAHPLCSLPLRLP
jgi:protein-S-isoprenylcysteine O-methyltransferase Ste14